MSERMDMADFRKQLANGDVTLRGRGRRGLPEHVQDAGRAAMIAEDEQKANRSPARGSGGTPTTVDGIRFPSIMEARVYQRLKLLAKAEGATLYRQVRYPLTNLAPLDDGSCRALWITIDFELFYPNDGRHRFIDAKAKRWASREWQRGKAAFATRYGHVIEECER